MPQHALSLCCSVVDVTLLVSLDRKYKCFGATVPCMLLDAVHCFLCLGSRQSILERSKRNISSYNHLDRFEIDEKILPSRVYLPSTQTPCNVARLVKQEAASKEEF